MDDFIVACWYIGGLTDLIGIMIFLISFICVMTEKSYNDWIKNNPFWFAGCSWRIEPLFILVSMLMLKILSTGIFVDKVKEDITQIT